VNTRLWIRQSQRGLSIAFTLAVIANFVLRAVASGDDSRLANVLATLPGL